MFGNIYVLVCWEKQVLISVCSDEEQALENANAYANLHKCEVYIEKYSIALD